MPIQRLQFELTQKMGNNCFLSIVEHGNTSSPIYTCDHPLAYFLFLTIISFNVTDAIRAHGSQG